MNFQLSELPPATVVETEPFVDQRGSFHRLYCINEYIDAGIDTNVVQTNLSFTAIRGSVRGMHFQAAPSQEAKIVRCIRGSIFDVIVDIRPSSPNYLKHLSIELTEDCNQALYVPVGFAHGFQTLSEDTGVLYHMMDSYEPELSFGLRWNDPALSISWPLPLSEISDKDANYPDLTDNIWF